MGKIPKQKANMETYETGLKVTQGVFKMKKPS